MPVCGKRRGCSHPGACHTPLLQARASRLALIGLHSSHSTNSAPLAHPSCLRCVGLSSCATLSLSFSPHAARSQMKRIVIWASIQYAAHVDGATIHVTGPDERQVEFGNVTTSFATLSGGEGYINSTVNVHAPDFLTMTGTSVNEMMDLIRAQQVMIVSQQVEIGALKTFVGMVPPSPPALPARSMVNRGKVTTIVAGTTVLLAPPLTEAGQIQANFHPSDVTMSKDGTALYFTTWYHGHNSHFVREVDIATGVNRIVAGDGSYGSQDGIGGAARVHSPQGVDLTPDGAALIFADLGSNSIRKIDLATDAVTTLVSGLSGPQGVKVAPDGTAAYVSERGTNAHRIRKLDLASNDITTLAGSSSAQFADGVGTAASFSSPAHMAISPDGDKLFVADSGNNRIRMIDIATHEVTTLAGSGNGEQVDGTGTAATLLYPMGVAISPDGANLFTTEWSGGRVVRQIKVATGDVTFLAGTQGQYAGCFDGTGADAGFYTPQGLMVSKDGTRLYVADRECSRVRQVRPAARFLHCVRTWMHPP